MYNETVLDHLQNPRNAGEIPEADGVGMVGNPACGDVMKVYIKVAGGRLVDVKFKTFGCAATIACSSMASELVKGKDIDKAYCLIRKEVVNALRDCPRRKWPTPTLPLMPSAPQ